MRAGENRWRVKLFYSLSMIIEFIVYDKYMKVSFHWRSTFWQTFEASRSFMKILKISGPSTGPFWYTRYWREGWWLLSIECHLHNHFNGASAQRVKFTKQNRKVYRVKSVCKVCVDCLNFATSEKSVGIKVSGIGKVWPCWSVLYKTMLVLINLLNNMVIKIMMFQ